MYEGWSDSTVPNPPPSTPLTPPSAEDTNQIPLSLSEISILNSTLFEFSKFPNYSSRMNFILIGNFNNFFCLILCCIIENFVI